MERVPLTQVYRCFVVCVDHWCIAAFPAATSVSALGGSYWPTGLIKVQFGYSNHSMEIVLGLISTYGHNSVHGRRYGIANALLTISTNVTVTILITCRVLRARRTLAKMLPLNNVRLCTGVVAILVESALPPSIFGIVAVALLLTAEHLNVPPSEGLVICSSLFTGLYSIFCVSSNPQSYLSKHVVGSLPSGARTTHDHIPC
jgi:uncharacterized membrane protein